MDAGDDEVSGGGAGHGDLRGEPGEGVGDAFASGVTDPHRKAAV
jgi:hypothetical protein